MKYLFSLLIIILSFGSNGQISHYNSYPSMNNKRSADDINCLLDNYKTNLGICFSMRKLIKDYTGPLLRLRRATDNNERNFYSHDSNILLDVASISTWAGSSELYITIWYDQSGFERHAIQNKYNKQARFINNSSMPYWYGDGVNDYLEVNTSIQNLTKQGAEGSVLCILKATNKSQHTFGVLTGRNRWSSHINWTNSNMYFDPGLCCNSSRNTANSVNVNIWAQYTLIRLNSRVLIKINKINKIDNIHNTGRCTLNTNFTLAWAKGDQATKFSSSSFNEFIMYNTDIPTEQYEYIENNQITFWGI